MAARFYELIGRLVVRVAWLRFSRQIKVAGIAIVVLGLVGGYLAARSQPPEG